MDNESKTADYQASAGKRPSKGGMIVGIFFLLLGAGWWVTYIQQTGGGYKTGELDTPFIVLGFAFWFVPWIIGTITTVVASARRRKITSLVVLPLGLVLLIAAIITTVTGAEPTPGGPGIH